MFPALAGVSRFPKSVVPTGLQFFFWMWPETSPETIPLTGRVRSVPWQMLVMTMINYDYVWYLGGFINQPMGLLFFLAGSWLMMVDFRILSTTAWCFMKKPLKVLGTDGNSFEAVTGSKGAAPLKVSPATWLSRQKVVPGAKWKLGLSLSVFRWKTFKQVCKCISMWVHIIYIYNFSFPCMCWRWLLIFPMGKGKIFVENT